MLMRPQFVYLRPSIEFYGRCFCYRCAASVRFHHIYNGFIHTWPLYITPHESLHSTHFRMPGMEIFQHFLCWNCGYDHPFSIHQYAVARWKYIIFLTFGFIIFWFEHIKFCLKFYLLKRNCIEWNVFYVDFGLPKSGSVFFGINLDNPSTCAISFNGKNSILNE